MPDESPRVFLAVDIGASSGRVMACLYDGRALDLKEVHRFPNGAVEIGGSYRWDFEGLMAQVEEGLTKAEQEYGPAAVSIGVDTWGVDYGLLDAEGNLADQPFAYRDPRTDGMMEEAFQRLAKREIYEVTGLQSMFFNTLYQLLSEVLSGREALSEADRLLFTPDLVNYRLCGTMANEYTIASTSQLLDARTRSWSSDLLKVMGIPEGLFSEPVQPGTVLGPWKEGINVVAVGSHDTASAVAAVPAEIPAYAYLSSGTWSLMGIESKEPVITDRSAELEFTNEGGVEDTIRVLKNICGMWLLQECRRVWAEQGEDLSWAEIDDLVAAAPPLVAFIDPDDTEFSTPGDMPARILAYCARTGQSLPNDKGAIARCIYESLAMRYRDVLAMLDELAGSRREVLHIVGGGSRNTLLNQMTANASGRPVIAGPTEATALGNVLIQMIAGGDIASLEEGRALIRTSFPAERFEPRDAAVWDEAYAKYTAVTTA